MCIEGQDYCKCNLIFGCENYVGYRGYCFIYWINNTYCSYVFKQITYQSIEFLKLASELLEDIRLCYEFDQSLNFWTEDYEHKCKDISSGVTGGIFLKDSIYF